MKYRALDRSELKELEQDFIKFLASNHITADDWVKLKAENQAKVNSLIEIYSDIVFDKILEKLEYLEFKTPHDIKTFHCQKEKMVLMGIAVDKKAGVDFTKNKTPKEMMEILKKNNNDLQIYTAEKLYNGDRKKELFGMLESGCLISKDGFLFKTLKRLKS